MNPRSFIASLPLAAAGHSLDKGHRGFRAQ